MTMTLIPPAPRRVRPPTGTSRLPVVELPRDDVAKPRKRIRIRYGSKKWHDADCSFGDFSDELRFNAWAFYHAAKKTELACSFTPRQLDRWAQDFADEYRELFVWRTANLRRVDRSVFEVEDFASKGLAGRFGEAVAYLFMISRGYRYWDRIGTLWERASRHQNISHAEMTKRARVIAAKIKSGRPDLEPDFAFETAAQEVALAEAKGSFVHPEQDNPNPKEQLSHALNQLAAWAKFIAPAPRKSFGIGAYFRDVSDTGKDPSLVAFVDPPSDADPETSPVEFPNDWIRRGNYGAWLIGMGFRAAGEALRNAAAYETTTVSVWVVNLSGRRFAVLPQRLVLKEPFRPSAHVPFWFHPRFFWDGPPDLILRELGIQGVEVLGLDILVLRYIERAIKSPEMPVLLGIEREDGTYENSPPQQTRVSLEGADGFDGSIMPDGSLVGILRANDLRTVVEERFDL